MTTEEVQELLKDMAEMNEHCRRLSVLLKAPEPGLSTWVQAVRHEITEIQRCWGE